MKSLVIGLGLAIFAGAGAALAEIGTAKVPTTDTERVANLESQLAELASRKPKLDCTTKYFRHQPSNHFMPSIPTPAGYHLVGGSCGFDSWINGDNPTLIQVGPTVSSDGTVSNWSCYGKQSRAVSFTATATFCRVVME